jgi:hydrogenase maturation protein HypF
MAIKEPWRMAMVYLSDAFGYEAKDLKIDLTKRVDLQKWDTLEIMIKKGFNTPWTSSMGRLFDAISSLLSVRDEVHYEGQAAIELEMIADHGEKETYPFDIQKGERPMIIDSTAIIRNVVGDLVEGTSTSKISGRFHRTIARLIIRTCEAIRSRNGLNRVVLSGGVFQNIFLLSLVAEGLRKSDFDVYTHHLVPTNDGGVSLGQAVIAHMRLSEM